MVGRWPRTWSAKLVDLMTSTEEMSESITSERRGELSIEMAFAFPLIMMVVLEQRLIRMDCEIEASTFTGLDSLS